MKRTKNLKKNLLQVVLALAFVLVLGVASSGKAEAAAIEMYPLQTTTSYTAKYTRALQVMLVHYSKDTRNYIIKSGGADGYYGEDTRKAVSLFQLTQYIADDGQCGPDTWKRFRKTLKYEKAANGRVYYIGKNPYTTNSHYKHNMSMIQTTGKWECYFEKWRPVG